MTPTWWSQPFAPEGSATAEGIVKQLGLPSLEPLTVLVREAAQNSWDARIGEIPVHFRLSLRRLGAVAETWHRYLLPPPDPRAGIPLTEGLNTDSLMLVVSDRNTVGLGGPLRAGHRAPVGERPDFVQFLRNIGEPNDNQFGGGTYGFGKGIFFRVSQVSTILVDTRTLESGSAGRRLMGSSLGPSWFDAHDRRYTGRHWWGTVVDNVPDPLLDDHAASVIDDLALPGFRDHESGTDIVVLAPDLGSTGGQDPRPRTPAETADFLVSSLLWHLWPKMIPDPDGRHMRFSVDLDGEPVDVPDPDDVPELRPFVRALQRVRGGDAVAYRRTVAPRHAGGFALEPDAAGPGPSNSVIDAARPFDGPSRHVARMRTAELVVDYLEATPHPNPLLRYGAVFKATEDADEHFAASEPPTHDSWVETGLSGTTKGVVQRARLFIHNQISATFAPAPLPTGDNTASLGELSSRLARLVPPSLPDLDTEAGGRGGGAGGRAGGSRTGAPRLLGTPILKMRDNGPVLLARVLIGASDTERAVTAEAHVVIDGGAQEQTPPIGASTPSILGWSSVTGDTEAVTGPVLRLPPGPTVEWWVSATHVEDAVVAFRVSSPSGRHRAS
ncbi:MAG: hypothetical protein ACRDTJ_30745 [Pseudonocardiaceae bacterium]